MNTEHTLEESANSSEVEPKQGIFVAVRCGFQFVPDDDRFV